MIEVAWNGSGSEFTTAVGPGFTLLPNQLGLWLWPTDGGLSVKLGNGLVNEANPAANQGLVSGTFALTYGGTTPIREPVMLHDGGWRGWRLGSHLAPAFDPVPWWGSWAWRWLDACRPEDRTAVLAKLATLNFAYAETPATDMPGSPRVCQSRWEGAVATADRALLEAVRTACLRWTDDQAERPKTYFDKDGNIYRRSDWWVDEHGIRKGLHCPWSRPSTSAWQLEDLEHLAPDRLATAAFAFRDPLAIHEWGAYVSAMLSRPGLATVRPWQQARALGYTLELLALAKRANESDLAIDAALNRVVAGAVMSTGYGVSGAPYIALRPPEAQHPSHVSVTLWDLQNGAPKLGVPWDPAWNALKPTDILKIWPKEAADAVRYALQGADCWGVSIIGRGAIQAMLAFGPTADLSRVLKMAAGFVLGPCRASNRGQDGVWFTPLHVVDSQAPRCQRAHTVNAEAGGTKRWIVPSGIEMLIGLQGDNQESMDDLCEAIWAHDSTLRLEGKGPDAVRIGLPAIARYGATP